MGQVGGWQLNTGSWIIKSQGKAVFYITEANGRLKTNQCKNLVAFEPTVDTIEITRSSVGNTRTMKKKLYQGIDLKITLGGEEFELRQYFNNFVNGVPMPKISIMTWQGNEKNTLKILYENCTLSFDNLPSLNNDNNNTIEASYSINCDAKLVEDFNWTSDDYGFSPMQIKD